MGISSADMGQTGGRYTVLLTSSFSLSFYKSLSGNNTIPKRYPKTGFNFLKFELPFPPLLFSFVSSSALLPIQLQSGYLLSSRSQLYNAPNTTGRSGWVEWISSRGRPFWGDIPSLAGVGLLQRWRIHRPTNPGTRGAQVPGECTSLLVPVHLGRMPHCIGGQRTNPLLTPLVAEAPKLTATWIELSPDKTRHCR